ncbi:phenylacetate-CoA ligase [Halovenus aranensis]|jgi:phenylacetate-CoA ligase|uniref:Phenylacetate-CoA ligase n=1 Tax=Halovenus aranensis TaxID=890420 RepID=A0A1G8RVM9_9EURY|nr:phenylacetate--CoA ligase family protein [Halovenus aranensis]SDJ21048.1 phenylacetate-CoA ligase [Halovenus aranensis]
MYDSTVLADLGEQLERASEYELYEQAFEDAGIAPADIDSWEAFQEVPFTEPGDLKADFDEHGPEGSLYTPGAMISFSPLGDDLAPMFDTEADLEYEAEVNASVLAEAGIAEGDRVANTFGYQLFGTGYLLHRGLEALGAEVLPLGPGDSEQAADTIEQFDVDALVGNPSFALKIAEAGATVDTFVGAGEPFTSVPGYREEVKSALGADTAVDYFGSRQVLPIASETAEEDGLHVTDEYAIVEIVDPDTGDPLGVGERGEVVVTHRRKEGFPLVRYRTGDLAELERRGDDLVLPNGVIGRTDDRLKVKGVKLYPEAVPTVLAGFDGLTGEYAIRVTRPDATDHLDVRCEGEADADALAAALSERLLISPDEVTVVSELEATGVLDERY